MLLPRYGQSVYIHVHICELLWVTLSVICVCTECPNIETVCYCIETVCSFFLPYQNLSRQVSIQF